MPSNNPSNRAQGKGDDANKPADPRSDYRIIKDGGWDSKYDMMLSSGLKPQGGDPKEYAKGQQIVDGFRKVDAAKRAQAASSSSSSSSSPPPPSAVGDDSEPARHGEEYYDTAGFAMEIGHGDLGPEDTSDHEDGPERGRQIMVGGGGGGKDQIRRQLLAGGGNPSRGDVEGGEGRLLQGESGSVEKGVEKWEFGEGGSKRDVADSEGSSSGSDYYCDDDGGDGYYDDGDDYYDDRGYDDDDDGYYY